MPGVAEAAERHRHRLLATPGMSIAPGTWPPEGAGEPALSVRGDAVVLTSLRRREAGWLEMRVVNLAREPRRAVVEGGLLEARVADLRGEPGEPLEVVDGRVDLDLGPAEIRTIRARRRETALGRAEVLDAAGPRQSA
jgi:mannosylglycerate hydrolase